MAMSTQRIFIIALMLNLVMGIVVDSYEVPSKYSDSMIKQRIDVVGEYSEDNKEGESTVTAQGSYVEVDSYLDTTKRTKSLFNLMVKGVKSPVIDITTESQVEDIILDVLKLITFVVNLLLLYELFLAIKSAKAT